MAWRKLDICHLGGLPWIFVGAGTNEREKSVWPMDAAAGTGGGDILAGDVRLGAFPLAGNWICRAIFPGPVWIERVGGCVSPYGRRSAELGRVGALRGHGVCRQKFVGDSLEAELGDMVLAGSTVRGVRRDVSREHQFAVPLFPVLGSHGRTH